MTAEEEKKFVAPEDGTVEEADTSGGASALEPCPILKELYNSQRPAVSLVRGVALAPIVSSVWVGLGAAEDFIRESWLPVPKEDDPPPPIFDPAAADFNAIPRRVSRSAPMVEWNKLKTQILLLEKKLEEKPDKLDAETREEMMGELAMAKEQFTLAESNLSELKTSFLTDALCLVPWMNTLFALADAGMTSFDVSGPTFPHCPLHKLFGEADSLDMYAGVERMLATFKRRYEFERGADKIQIFTKLVPNIFTDKFEPKLVVDAIDRSLSRMQFTQLDLVQLFWWDFKEKDIMPTLKALKQLTLDEVAINPDTNEVTIVTPAKIKAIGLLDFPYRAILDAIQMGIPVTLVQMNYNLCDRSAEAVLALCGEYGIKVVARNGTLGGLINEKYLGVESPDTLVGDPDINSLAESLDLVQRFGGWEKFQKLLGVLKEIGDKHKVSIQTVALRLQMDKGTFPLCPVNWEPFHWMPYGHPVWMDHFKPGVDHKLFHKSSFLDESDLSRLDVFSQ